MRSSWSGAVPVLLAMAFQAPAAFAQIDLAGQWAAQSRHEDVDHRIPGAELGDYTGIPLNDAGRLKARTWDASILSQPEQQAKPHPAQYSMRGPGPNFRMGQVLDPVSNAIVAYTITGLFGNADRTIWMDGRAHPSALAAHTWGGFSTGVWAAANVLVVTTTHMKAAFVQRNGVPSSAKGTMTECFFRHGQHLVLATVIDDPVYLEEPFVRTSNFVWAPAQVVAPAAPFEIVDEVAGQAAGYVPHYPLGTRHTEFAERHGLPFEATQGGRETIYPEYAAKLKQLMTPRTPAPTGR
jgi:hypothetical protein